MTDFAEYVMSSINPKNLPKILTPDEIVRANIDGYFRLYMVKTKNPPTKEQIEKKLVTYFSIQAPAYFVQKGFMEQFYNVDNEGITEKEVQHSYNYIYGKDSKFQIIVTLICMCDQDFHSVYIRWLHQPDEDSEDGSPLYVSVFPYSKISRPILYSKYNQTVPKIMEGLDKSEFWIQQKVTNVPENREMVIYEGKIKKIAMESIKEKMFDFENNLAPYRQNAITSVSDLFKKIRDIPPPPEVENFPSNNVVIQKIKGSQLWNLILKRVNTEFNNIFKSPVDKNQIRDAMANLEGIIYSINLYK